MKKGIPYDIVEEFKDDDGKWFVKGVSDDGEEATEEIFMPLEKQLLGQPEQSNQCSINSQGEDRIA